MTGVSSGSAPVTDIDRLHSVSGVVKALRRVAMDCGEAGAFLRSGIAPCEVECEALAARLREDREWLRRQADRIACVTGEAV